MTVTFVKNTKSKPVYAPSVATCAKYGITPVEWMAILEAQGGVCSICKKLPPSGKMVIDHFHVKGWKQMKPEHRKLHIRGILCWVCNQYMGRGFNLDRAKNIVTYLEKHHAKPKRLSE